MIDYQYEEVTFAFWIKLFILYLTFYYLPLIYIILGPKEDVKIKEMCQYSILGTGGLFFFFELLQLNYLKFDYFLNKWNMFQFPTIAWTVVHFLYINLSQDQVPLHGNVNFEHLKNKTNVEYLNENYTYNTQMIQFTLLFSNVWVILHFMSTFKALG